MRARGPKGEQKTNGPEVKEKGGQNLFTVHVLIAREKTINYLCTYDLYSPVHNVLDACISITWGSGRGLGPGIPEFFGPCEMGTSR
jgi:hypothetical protein